LLGEPNGLDWSESRVNPFWLRAGTNVFIRRRLAGLAVVFCASLGLAEDSDAVVAQSGHHYAAGSLRDNAFIGIDFGRNSFGGRSVSFRTNGGRNRLKTALVKAVSAGEGRMSFDFGFDLRSVILREGDGFRLDDDVLPSIEAFLNEVEQADAAAQDAGRRFGVDVVLLDYRVADGVATERDAGTGDLVAIGEYPEFMTDAEEREKLLTTLEPALRRLGRHSRVTLNLMNEPEFMSLPASEVQARIDLGLWRRSAVVQAAVFDAVTVRRDQAAGKIVLTQSEIPPEAAIGFLRDLHTAVKEAAPSARVTVGWADDRSALLQTGRLEETGGFRLVTDVIGFHVYPAFGRGITSDRSTFAEAFGDRPIRITEWGLGFPANLADALGDALSTASDAGVDGVLFWWDDAHSFSHDAFGQAITGRAVDVDDPGERSPDFDGNSVVDLNDFLAFVSRFGTRRGGDGFSSRFDLDADGVIGFGDFLILAAAFGG